MKGLSVLKLLIKDWKGSYKWLVFSLFLVMISVFGTLLIPYFSSFLINEGITAGNSDVMVKYGIYMLIMAVIVGFCEFLNIAIAVSFSERTCHGLRSGAFAHIQSFSFSALDKYNSSDLLVRLTTDIQNIKIGVQQTLINVFKSPLTLIVALFFLYLTAPEFMWVAAILIIIEILLLAVYLWYSTKAYDKKQIKYDRLNQVLKESMVGVRVVKAFVRQDLENKRFQNASEELREAALKPQYYYAFITPTLMMMVYMGTVGILYVGGTGLLQGTGLTLGGVTAAMTYLVMALIPIQTVGYMIPFVTSGISSLQRVYEIINEETDVVTDPNVKPVNIGKFKGGVHFKNVSFAYPVSDENQPTMALKNINLEIEPGEIVGILGATGSGKSTLVNLIPRFYDVTEGEIQIDGIDVRDMPLETLRYVASVCLQGSNFFSGTIRDNLVAGVDADAIIQAAQDFDVHLDPENMFSDNINSSYDAMVQAAKAADAHEFVKTMPQKYDTTIARGGADLSGGQRQRLSIARTLMMNPKILILDDSTSAVDVATEARIQDSIHDLMQGVTQIIVAQRISAVITADKIVLMDNGEIVAIGSHEELLESNKLYQDIYASQFGVDVPKQGVVG
ncbi:MAG: ABC transporter ATP-binding protein [Euryarchaeota archaeon]|uniref:ABC transporter ATP-binding protein n=1 Tax=Methanobacterium sp. MZD130B TaxID=3394378 RepID=UPI0009C859AE|nr:ABC transporter ATP-binding protein [Euryarchaeota archaeon]OPZ88985.1 MAG: putative multidrug export ATP-binding/permease protein [Firmicutes bacterium ADurb.Bin419]HHT19662.1 ABC transporter ATP-binding protein [Methanobacterium sp.]